MNKVIQANLGGLAFTLDDDAYALLDDYLARVDGYFRGSPGHADIMHDIEARLAELFTANLRGRSIVTASDVAAATATLGTPEQMNGGVDARADEAHAGRSSSSSDTHARERRTGYSSYGKKLMRDPDDKVLGGVCAGLSAYFGIDSPVWLRGAFAVAVFVGGFGVLPYVLLWIAMPVARTAGDKLAMRGEPVDLHSIAQQVEDEATQIANRLTEWGDEVNRVDWKNAFKRRDQRGERARRERDENFTV